MVTVFSILTASAQTPSVVSIGDFTLDKDATITAPIYIQVNDASGLGSATIELKYNPGVIKVLQVTNGEFDSMTPNIDNNAGSVRLVTYQTGAAGVGPGSIKFADIELQAIGAAGSESLLELEVVTIRNNTGSLVIFSIDEGTVKIKGINNDEYSVGSKEVFPETIEEVQIDDNNSNNETIDEVGSGSQNESVAVFNETGGAQENEDSPGIPGFEIVLSIMIIIFIKITRYK